MPCYLVILFNTTDTREKNEAFGSSLLLANSPMSPKIVNGSFAAICDTDEFMAKDFAGIRMAAVSLKVVLSNLSFDGISLFSESKLASDAQTRSWYSNVGYVSNRSDEMRGAHCCYRNFFVITGIHRVQKTSFEDIVAHGPPLDRINFAPLCLGT